MLPLHSDSALDLPLIAVDRSDVVMRSAEDEVLRLFDRSAPSLLRYVASCGLSAGDCEDVVQDVFVALFRHLRLGRSRENLRAWLFQVAHNLALKQRARLRRRATQAWDEAAHDRADPSPGPEALLVRHQRRGRMRPVLRALPARDRHCLFLRAEGLRYREIAESLGMSLGGVAKSLARSIARLVNVDRG